MTPPLHGKLEYSDYSDFNLQSIAEGAGESRALPFLKTRYRRFYPVEFFSWGAI
jgi:hypothetical protein